MITNSIPVHSPCSHSITYSKTLFELDRPIYQRNEREVASSPGRNCLALVQGFMVCGSGLRVEGLLVIRA